MKKVFKMILPLIIIILLATIINATTIQNNKGYHNSTVFVQNKSSLFSSEVTLGIAAWDAISPRSITVNSVSSSTVCDESFSDPLIKSFVGSDKYGYYYQVTTNNNTCCNTSWFHILLNTDELSSNNTTLTKRVVAHEFGHALNLGHCPNNDDTDLMYKYSNSCTANKPTSTEQKNVQNHWNNNH